MTRLHAWLVGLALVVAASPALAANWPTGQQAYTAALGYVTNVGPPSCQYYYGNPFQGTRVTYHANSASGSDDYSGEFKCNGTWYSSGNCNNHTPCPNGGYSAGRQYFPHLKYCPTGQTWQPDTFTCFDPAVCNAKPAISIGTLNIDIAGMKACVDGCEFQAQNGTTNDLTTHGGDHIKAYSGGSYKPTGAQCAAGQVPPGPVTQQQCVTDSESSVPVCVKSDGQHCIRMPSGRQECWKPFETGERTDGDTLQVRNAGSVPTTPQTPPPAGDTFAQAGASTTTTATTTDPSGSARTLTATTTNYTTASGANAGSTDQGEPGDGSGAGATPTGDSDSERNSLLGGIKDKLSAMYDGLFGDGTYSDNTGLDATAGSVMSDQEYGTDGFDESGFGYGRTCPAPLTIEVHGHTFTFDANGALCDWMVAGGWFVLMLTGLACMYIYAGRSKS